MNRYRQKRLGGLRFLGLAVLIQAAVAAGGTDVQIDTDPAPPTIIQNETSITIVPSAVAGQPTLIGVAYNDDPLGTTGLGVSLSTDFGVNWGTTQLPMPTDQVTGANMPNAFDPAIGADTQGRLFTAQISGSPSGGSSGLYVHSYDPNTTTWSGAPSTVSYDGILVAGQEANYRFNDKCHLAVDLDPSSLSSYQDRVYVTWIKDRGYQQASPWSDIYFAWSTDQAQTWNYPNPLQTQAQEINDNPGDLTGLGLANGPNAAVAPNGDVYVAWLNVDVTAAQDTNATLYVDKSTDGGLNWGTDVAVYQGFNSCPAHLSKGPGIAAWDDARARSFPSMAVSPSNSNHVYIVYAEDTTTGDRDEGDIYLVRSTDGGATWPHRVQINSDGTTTDQFEPWIAVKSDGTIDVAWFDRRNDPNDTLWDVYVAKSTDGGATFSTNVRVTDLSFATPSVAALGGEPWMGEYLGITTDSAYAYLAFVSAASDSTHGDVYFDMLPNSAIPEPASAILLMVGSVLFLRRRRRK